MPAIGAWLTSLLKLVNLNEVAEETVKATLKGYEPEAEAELAKLREDLIPDAVAKVVALIPDPALSAVVGTALEAELDNLFDRGVDAGTKMVWDLIERINPKDAPEAAPDLTPDS